VEDVEQYSEESRRQLEEATVRLVDLLRSYTTHVAPLQGRSTEVAALFTRNDELQQAVATWNEAALDHTGTVPLALARIDDEDDDFADDADGGERGGQVSVVSRWDLDIVDSAELIAAGRAAHRRLRPEDDDEDAAQVVSDAPAALYALTHETGEPWYEVPGVEVIGGVRLYVAPDAESDDLEASSRTLRRCSRQPVGSSSPRAGCSTHALTRRTRAGMLRARDRGPGSRCRRAGRCARRRCRVRDES
jgi:hypothetical protein